MSIARANPKDSEHGAKALTWKERKAIEKYYSPWERHKRNMASRNWENLLMIFKDGYDLSKSHHEEKLLLMEKREQIMKLSGPKDGLDGTLVHEDVSGEPAYIKRIREEFQDEKPVRPKQQIFSEHQLKANRYEIDINYTPLAMTEMARQSRLEDQYVAAQMKYVNSLEANKGMRLTHSRRREIQDALRLEFKYLQGNPTAKPKDMSDIIDNFAKLGKPSPDDQITPAHSRLLKLKSRQTIERQTKTALEISEQTLNETIKLQRDPAFHALTPEEQIQHIESIRDELAREKAQIFAEMALTEDEINQLLQYKQIETSTNQPMVPLSNHQDEYEGLPCVISSNGTRFSMVKDINPSCSSPLLDYQQCLTSSRLSVPQCAGYLKRLASCHKTYEQVEEALHPVTWLDTMTTFFSGLNPWAPPPP